MFYFRIKLDTENASRLRVERRGAQQVAGKQTSCNLCALAHEGRFQFFDFEGIIFYKCGCFFDGTQRRRKISPRLISLMFKWNVEFKCLLTFFGQLAPLRIMPKTGTAPKPERLSRRAKHDAAVTPHLKTSLLRKPNRGLGWQSSSN